MTEQETQPTKHYGCCCIDKDGCCHYCTDVPACPKCGDYMDRYGNGGCESGCDEEEEKP